MSWGSMIRSVFNSGLKGQEEEESVKPFCQWIMSFMVIKLSAESLGQTICAGVKGENISDLI
ncbi:hypothetical protein BDA96_01G221700 [Sorghum bicolor]|uniref:Uncharacterized protein n=2 Tax=Sorghum bicolor TaxID=4558 RepID=A0A921UY16_SORBI|nr:hypothetical protein BDA96_01G221700 [Sorghum bicolor]KXG38265.2 hypothetical protein SORBI_3001G208133 [Sorghum bicolor]